MSLALKSLAENRLVGFIYLHQTEMKCLVRSVPEANDLPESEYIWELHLLDELEYQIKDGVMIIKTAVNDSYAKVQDGVLSYKDLECVAEEIKT